MTIKIDRTHDMEMVRSILLHPAIWPHIHDDNANECNPLDHEGLFWMLAADAEPAGVFLLHAHNSVCYEVHTCLLPRVWGDRAVEAAKACRAWMFQNTGCRKLITNVPAYNVLALRFAKRCGFKPEGVNRASFLKNGELQDQHVLGLTKEEWQCLQSSPQ